MKLPETQIASPKPGYVIVVGEFVVIAPIKFFMQRRIERTEFQIAEFPFNVAHKWKNHVRVISHVAFQLLYHSNTFGFMYPIGIQMVKYAEAGKPAKNA